MTFWSELKKKIAPHRFSEDHNGMQAHANARSQLAQTKRRSQEVDRVTDSLRDLREHNHFGDAVEAAMRLRRS